MSRDARGDAGQERLLTRPFVLMGIADLAYFTSIGVAIYTLPLYTTGPIGSDEAGAGWAYGVFGVTALLCRPFAGRLTDLHGRLPLMIIGASLAALGMALLPFAWMASTSSPNRMTASGCRVGSTAHPTAWRARPQWNSSEQRSPWETDLCDDPRLRPTSEEDGAMNSPTRHHPSAPSAGQIPQWQRSLPRAGAVAPAFTTLCCLGFTAALSLASAVGATFLTKDATLKPLLVATIILTLVGSALTYRRHRNALPLILTALA